MTKRSAFITLILFSVYSISFCQPAPIDELMARLDGNLTNKEIVDVYADIAYNYVWDDAALSYAYAKSGIELADSIEYEFGRAKCVSEAGLALLYMGSGPEALEYLFEALEVLNRHNDDFWLFTTLSSIGYIYWELDEYQSSLQYFKQANDFSDSLNIDNFKIGVLSDIGETYIKLVDLDSGMVYVEQSYNLAISTNDSFQIAVTANQLGILQRLSGNLEQSLHYSRQSLSYAIGIGWNSRRTYLNIAEVYLLKEDFDSCVSYAHKCVQSSKYGSFMDEYLLRGITLLSKSYENLHMQDSMVAYLRQQIETNAIIVDKEKTKRIQGIVFNRQMDESKIEQAKKEAVMEASLSRQRIYVRIGFFIVGIVLIFTLILVNGVRMINSQKRAIQNEKERGDELLLNILPEKIAIELKGKGKVDAVRFDEVAVLFTDFVDFTKFSSTWSAEYLVREIDHCFSAFDEIIYRHGLEKIKTVGDAYMAAGGMPNLSPGYLQHIISAALEILAYMNKRSESLEKIGRETFQLRIGIHTGPVVAGVVGVRKFAYDIWGDTVNVASRMESNGVPGKVNISKSVYQKIKANSAFNFIQRPLTDVKGKGEMQMYLVEKKKTIVTV